MEPKGANSKTSLVGCTVQVKAGETTGDEWREAEILQVRTVEDDEMLEYYVHFTHFNKRLDTWISHDCLDLGTLKQPPAPTARPPHPQNTSKKKTAAGSSQTSKKAVASKSNKTSKSKSKGGNKRKAHPDGSSSSPSAAVKDEPGGAGTGDEADRDDEERDDDGKQHDKGDDENDGGFSKEKEIKRLRTSGSMTQSVAEIARVKNIKRISMGKFECETWYFSPYPEEYTRLSKLFICEFCLDPVGPRECLVRHRTKCTIRHPPGNEIYRKNEISFFEIDGRKQRRYCRNLCMLSKLFLDHKTLYYDVDPFLFYLMTESDSTGHHLIGYFSKEKQSSEDYNVACILTLPQYQRKGFGKLLIQFSYELSKIERKLGSPEKPLSDLGLLSYRSFWAENLIDILYHAAGSEVSVQALADMTAFTADDIMSTLQTLEVVKFYKGSFILCLDPEHLESWKKRQSARKRRDPIDPACIKWTPPKFAPSQLRFL